MTEKVRENRLRRIAERRGLVLTKSRQRDPDGITYGCYQLSDARSRLVIQGVDDPYGRGFPFRNLNEVQEWLNPSPWQAKVRSDIESLRGNEEGSIYSPGTRRA
jgi:hypothetical protein